MIDYTVDSFVSFELSYRRFNVCPSCIQLTCLYKRLAGVAEHTSVVVLTSVQLITLIRLIDHYSAINYINTVTIIKFKIWRSFSRLYRCEALSCNTDVFSALLWRCPAASYRKTSDRSSHILSAQLPVSGTRLLSEQCQNQCKNLKVCIKKHTIFFTFCSIFWLTCSSHFETDKRTTEMTSLLLVYVGLYNPNITLTLTLNDIGCQSRPQCKS